MILDASAIVAILTEEPGCERLFERLLEAETLGVGAPTLLEAGIVLRHRLGSDPIPLLDRFLQELDAEVLPFGEPHWNVALEAFRRFGKGRHPAALNFGDCLAYAIAKISRQHLLCIGNDFAQTDIGLA